MYIYIYVTTLVLLMNPTLPEELRTYNMPFIQLKSSDEIIFPVDVEVAKVSNMLRDMLDSTPEDEDNTPIPLEGIEAEVLRRVIWWAEQYYKNYEKPPSPSPSPSGSEGRDEEKRLGDVCHLQLPSYPSHFSLPPQLRFLDVGKEILFGILRAADFLDITPLREAICKTIAQRIQGKPSEAMREFFNL